MDDDQETFVILADGTGVALDTDDELETLDVLLARSRAAERENRFADAKAILGTALGELRTMGTTLLPLFERMARFEIELGHATEAAHWQRIARDQAHAQGRTQPLSRPATFEAVRDASGRARGELTLARVRCHDALVLIRSTHASALAVDATAELAYIEQLVRQLKAAAEACRVALHS